VRCGFSSPWNSVRSSGCADTSDGITAADVTRYAILAGILAGLGVAYWFVVRPAVSKGDDA
jgi:hypothetical protein